MIEIGEDNPDLAWVHSSWDRWSEQIISLPRFLPLRNREGLIIGTLPAGDVELAHEIESDWEKEMFEAERDSLPEPKIDFEPTLAPEERTTVFRLGGERPFWIEVETESRLWVESLGRNPWAVQISRTPDGVRERWLVPQALLQLG